MANPEFEGSGDEVENIADYVTEIADGALIHIENGIVSIMFYQNRSIPKFESVSEEPVPVHRRILYEARLPFKVAEAVTEDLKVGLRDYEADIQQMAELNRNAIDVKAMELVYSYIGVENMSIDGRQLVLKLLDKFIKENKDALEAIQAKYPKAVGEGVES